MNQINPKMTNIILTTKLIEGTQQNEYYYFTTDGQLRICTYSELPKDLKSHSHLLPTSPKFNFDGISDSPYIQLILKTLKNGTSYDDFIRISQDPEIQRKYIGNRLLRKYGGKSFFFNSDGVYTSIVSKRAWL